MFFNKATFTALASMLLMAASVSAQPIKAVEVAPEGFRYSLEEMQDIANSKRLPHRMFYLTPSQGPDAAWFDAVKKGNLELVTQMVENGQNIEAKDEAALGQTALGWAAFIGYQDMVEYLVEHNADLFATDRGDVYNAFKSAIMGNNITTVKYLYARLKDHIDVNAFEDDGETMVIVAASNNRAETVEFFLSIGANVNLVAPLNTPYYKGESNALAVACNAGAKEAAEVLIQAGATNYFTGKASCEKPVQ